MDDLYSELDPQEYILLLWLYDRIPYIYVLQFNCNMPKLPLPPQSHPCPRSVDRTTPNKVKETVGAPGGVADVAGSASPAQQRRSSPRIHAAGVARSTAISSSKRPPPVQPSSKPPLSASSVARLSNAYLIPKSFQTVQKKGATVNTPLEFLPSRPQDNQELFSFRRKKRKN